MKKKREKDLAFQVDGLVQQLDSVRAQLEQKDNQVQDLERQVIEKDQRISNLSIELEQLKKETIFNECMTSVDFIFYKDMENERPKEGQTWEDAFQDGSLEKVKYYNDVFGPAGMERQKIIKKGFRRVVENLVPLFFIHDVMAYQYGLGLPDEEYQRILDLPEDQREFEIESAGDQVTFIEAEWLKCGVSTSIKNMVFVDLQQTYLDIYAEFRNAVRVLMEVKATIFKLQKRMEDVTLPCIRQYRVGEIMKVQEAQMKNIDLLKKFRYEMWELKIKQFEDEEPEDDEDQLMYLTDYDDEEMGDLE